MANNTDDSKPLLLPNSSNNDDCNGCDNHIHANNNYNSTNASQQQCVPFSKEYGPACPTVQVLANILNCLSSLCVCVTVSNPHSPFRSGCVSVCLILNLDLCQYFLFSGMMCLCHYLILSLVCVSVPNLHSGCVSVCLILRLNVCQCVLFSAWMCVRVSYSPSECVTVCLILNLDVCQCVLFSIFMCVTVLYNYPSQT